MGTLCTKDYVYSVQTQTDSGPNISLRLQTWMDVYPLSKIYGLTQSPNFGIRTSLAQMTMLLCVHVH